jgi:ABC-type branched-subunit amino acid transport system substrate-binding protein
VMLPMTGPFASGGDYVKVLNAEPKIAGHDKIDGHPYQIIVKDDTGNAATGGGLIRELIDQDKVNVIIGSNVTAVQGTVLPVMTAAKMLNFSLSGCPACGDGAANPYTFSLEFDRPTQGPATINRVKSLKKTTIAILESQDPTSKDYSKAVTAAASSIGGVTIVKSVPFQPATLDLSNQITQLKAANPDVVYIASFAQADIASTAKAMNEAGWHPVVMGNSAVGTQVVVDAVGPSGKSWLAKWESSGWGKPMLNGSLSSQAKQWGADLTRILGSGIPPILNAQAAAADAFDIYKAAVEATHSLDGPTLATWIQTHGYPTGLRAAYTFTPARHNGFTADDVGWATPGTAVDHYLSAAPST